MDILIKGGRLLDPANDAGWSFDIRIRDGKILKVMEPSTERKSRMRQQKTAESWMPLAVM